MYVDFSISVTQAGSKESYCYHRIIVCAYYSLYLVIISLAKDSPCVWMEKSGLGWKKQCLPSICSASLVTWMCWLLQGCRQKKTLLSVILSFTQQQTESLFVFHQTVVKCDTHNTHTCLHNFFLECAELSENFGQFWRICCFRWNIYRQCAVNPAVVATERRNLFFLDLWVMLERKNMHWSLIFAYSYTHGCCMYYEHSC